MVVTELMGKNCLEFAYGDDLQEWESNADDPVAAESHHAASVGHPGVQVGDEKHVSWHGLSGSTSDSANALEELWMLAMVEKRARMIEEVDSGKDRPEDRNRSKCTQRGNIDVDSPRCRKLRVRYEQQDRDNREGEGIETHHQPDGNQSTACNRLAMDVVILLSHDAFPRGFWSCPVEPALGRAKVEAQAPHTVLNHGRDAAPRFYSQDAKQGPVPVCRAIWRSIRGCRRRGDPLLEPALAGATAMVFVLALAYPALAVAPEEAGDVNLDGDLDAGDLLRVLRIIDGDPPAEGEVDRGDVAPFESPDAALDAGDAMLLMRALDHQDVDVDGLSTEDERFLFGTNPFPSATDGQTEDAELDPDNDSLTHAEELAAGTDPFLADTDGDGLNDGEEVDASGDPLTGTRYRHGDHLGSTVVATGAAAGAIEQTLYRPYGEAVDVSPGLDDAPEFGFTGQRREPGLGLHDYRARWYDPSLGRFLEPDPIVADVYSPQTLNAYSYVLGNPTNLVDPTGMAGVDPPTGGLPEGAIWGNVLHEGSGLTERPGGGFRVDPLLGTLGGATAGNLTDLTGSSNGSTASPGDIGSTNALYQRNGETIQAPNEPKSQRTEGLAFPVDGFRTIAGELAGAEANSFEAAGLVEHDDCVQADAGCVKIGFPPIIAPGSAAAADVRALGAKAITTSGRAGSQLLRRMATRAGLTVEKGGKHLTVRNPDTGKAVTPIPNTLKGKGTARDIVNKILRAVGLE